MSEFSNKLTPAQTERLAILIEECSEVQQIACKILRHGYDSYNPRKQHIVYNKSLLQNELGDLMFIIEFMQKLNDVDATQVRYACINKRNTIEQYLHHNALTKTL